MVVAPLGPQLASAGRHTGQDRVPDAFVVIGWRAAVLPMAALYDGRHYMAERFNNVLFTPRELRAYDCCTNLRITRVAMGLYKSYGGLPALPGVMPELEAVVHDPAVPAIPRPDGGRLLPDEQFTLAALRRSLGGLSRGAHRQPFCGGSGNGEEPYLMLGWG